MTRREVERLVADVSPGLKKLVAREVASAVADLESRCSRQDERLLAVENAPRLKYCGVYTDGSPYDSGSLVTRSGSLWYAEISTSATPGSEGSGWRLIAKGGRS